MVSMNTAIAPYAKAITGAVIAGLGSLGVALTPDAVTQAVSVTPAEYVACLTATLTASLLIWAIPNADTPEQVEAKVALAEKRVVEADEAALDGHQGALEF